MSSQNKSERIRKASRVPGNQNSKTVSGGNRTALRATSRARSSLRSDPMCECAQTCDLRAPNHRPQGLACLHRGNGAKHGQKHSRDPSGLRFAPAERPWKPACYMETRPALKGITWAGAPDESDTPTTTLERDMGAPTTTLGRDRGAPPRVGYGLGIRVGYIPIRVDPRRYMPSRLGIGPTHPGQASAPRAAPT